METSGIRADEWLSKQFGRPVFQLHVIEPTGAQAAAALAAHVAGQTRAFYYSKVNVAEVAVLAALTRADMSVVDVNVIFGIDAASVGGDRPVPAEVDIREVRRGDVDEVLAIAETSFRYTRFHLDPLVSKPIADRIKREWIASYCTGRRGEGLWIAMADGHPAAFLAVLGGDDHGRRHKVIDLVAVAPRFQGRGIGRALVNFFLAHYAPHCDRLRVGTQIANVPSAQLYESAGMTIERAQYVLHMHVPESRG